MIDNYSYFSYDKVGLKKEESSDINTVVWYTGRYPGDTLGSPHYGFAVKEYAIRSVRGRTVDDSVEFVAHANTAINGNRYSTLDELIRAYAESLIEKSNEEPIEDTAIEGEKTELTIEDVKDLDEKIQEDPNVTEENKDTIILDVIMFSNPEITEDEAVKMLAQARSATTTEPTVEPAGVTDDTGKRKLSTATWVGIGCGIAAAVLLIVMLVRK